MSAWIIECFDWFDARFAPPKGLILPTRDFFSAGRGEDAKTAEAVIADIKRHMGFQGAIEVAPLDMLPAEYRHEYGTLSEVAGTYQRSGNAALIRYNPEEMRRPVQFIGTMAHELMHARLEGLQDAVPGGAGAHELATDLGCIIAGFGVFHLQGGDDAGWAGYMTQSSRAYALAVFLLRRDLGAEAVNAHLSARARKLLTRGLKEAKRDLD